MLSFCIEYGCRRNSHREINIPISILKPNPKSTLKLGSFIKRLSRNIPYIAIVRPHPWRYTPRVGCTVAGTFLCLGDPNRKCSHFGTKTNLLFGSGSRYFMLKKPKTQQIIDRSSQDSMFIVITAPQPASAANNALLHLCCQLLETAQSHVQSSRQWPSSRHLKVKTGLLDY